MARLYVLLFVTQIVLAVVALISCLSADDDGIRGLPRFGWVLIILFFPLVGSIAWFLAGRPVPTQRPGTPGVAGRRRLRPERRQPAAPDDDPEFLRSLNARQSRADRELFERWEQDLHQREEELRRRESGDPQPHGDNQPEP